MRRGTFNSFKIKINMISKMQNELKSVYFTSNAEHFIAIFTRGDNRRTCGFSTSSYNLYRYNLTSMVSIERFQFYRLSMGVVQNSLFVQI